LRTHIHDLICREAFSPARNSFVQYFGGDTLDASLLLLPLVGTAGPAAVLAVLIGVNVGPNLTYVGSLANLLWRSVVRRDIRVGFVEFTRIGLLTTPITLLVAVLGLWLGTRLVGV